MEARIFNSHIDIISPGELLRPLTIEKLQEHDYKPNSRNKAITKVLLRKGIMDERGSGILRMEESIKKCSSSLRIIFFLSTNTLSFDYSLFFQFFHTLGMQYFIQ
ncbi:MAG: hypothetical protein KKA61_01280 [Nanoarchaeota archaeon]|nr:hypothetical protein [Nanoarchaeota archaeon]